MANHNVGIRDVAKAAGVSVTTVSHILNNTPHTRASAETRERVRAAARDLGYGPNLLARGLRTQKSELIGLVSEEIATTPHAGRIILGAQEAARRHNLALLIVSVERGPETENHSKDIEMLLERQIEGLLYATMFHREITLPASAAGTPTVLIDAEDRAFQAPCVVPDEYGGARAAMRVLLDAGHRRIGFLNNDDDIPPTRERLRGYRDALSDAGVAVDPSLILSGASETASGYELSRILLSRPDRPTALFCYNDRLAMGAYRAAGELGLDIPADLSVVGFDNQEIIAANLFPGLTTVALPHYEMGAWAVDTLARILSGPRDESLLAGRPTMLDCPLKERESVAAPKA